MCRPPFSQAPAVRDHGTVEVSRQVLKYLLSPARNPPGHLTDHVTSHGQARARQPFSLADYSRCRHLHQLASINHHSSFPTIPSVPYGRLATVNKTYGQWCVVLVRIQQVRRGQGLGALSVGLRADWGLEVRKLGWSVLQLSPKSGLVDHRKPTAGAWASWLHAFAQGVENLFELALHGTVSLLWPYDPNKDKVIRYEYARGVLGTAACKTAPRFAPFKRKGAVGDREVLGSRVGSSMACYWFYGSLSLKIMGMQCNNRPMSSTTGEVRTSPRISVHTSNCRIQGLS